MLAAAWVMKLYISQNGVESGPYSLEQVTVLMSEGKLLSSDCIRTERKKWFCIPQDKQWIPVGLLPGVEQDLNPSTRRTRRIVAVWLSSICLFLVVRLVSCLIEK
jgi:hypothetical protein